MFDARRLLDQVLNSAQTGDLSQVMGQFGQQGQGQGQAPTGPAGGATSGGTGMGKLATGALAGGVVGMLMGNKKARKMVGRTAGTALTLGGLAAVGALAYTAWQRRSGGGQPAPAQAAPAQAHSGPALLTPPADSPFSPAQAPGGEDNLARGVLVAMIQGAKADGHIDAEEQTRIFGHLDNLGLDAEAKAFVMDELAAPQDINRVRHYADRPEVGAELYAASLLAMDPDTPTERRYLTELAAALGIDPGLAAEIEQTVAVHA
ncbi:MAG: hypothetical protein HLUCCO17_00400 [Saliniramus fredricksonii]|uniref:Uncharacterized membrane protein YebE, DUF533 family n=1 Tax=Saliniramus fredricksonii TaxID=1653334 RepID=A0A0P7XB66_9HYPH|nr:tellurite resistance TerB family protein [Saliniramus fredricksonii]KPQ12587.1 MAG: hypothetical protein HLUCCO17_00400 [Saliniramus fredricksonii]SCC82738.1 Uncharacterized membrane protein YebE, DUF533 family [Saliniramus fredricksonii]